MGIRITSKRDGFYRCGMPHPAAPVEYPDGRFTKKELAVLKAEPMLVVEETEEKKAGKDKDKDKSKDKDKDPGKE